MVLYQGVSQGEYLLSPGYPHQTSPAIILTSRDSPLEVDPEAQVTAVRAGALDEGTSKNH